MVRSGHHYFQQGYAISISRILLCTGCNFQQVRLTMSLPEDRMADQYIILLNAPVDWVTFLPPVLEVSV
jgi:hypothetical protein